MLPAKQYRLNKHGLHTARASSHAREDCQLQIDSCKGHTCCTDHCQHFVNIIVPSLQHRGRRKQSVSCPPAIYIIPHMFWRALPLLNRHRLTTQVGLIAYTRACSMAAGRGDGHTAGTWLEWSCRQVHASSLLKYESCLYVYLALHSVHKHLSRTNVLHAVQ